MDSILDSITRFYELNILAFFKDLIQYPIKIVALIIDVSIVGYLLYLIVKMLKGTRAMQLVKGIAILLVATALSEFFSLKILHYILSSVTTYGVITAVIIFQPELRKTLEQMGSTDIRKMFDFDTEDQSLVDEAVEALYAMSEEKIGALIVFEREMSLSDIVSTGVIIDAKVSSELLRNVFIPDTVLHDGAVVIRNRQDSCRLMYFTSYK